MLTTQQREHVLIGLAGGTPEPYRVIADGRALWVYAMVTGNGRLCIGHVDNRWGFDEAYCYQGIEPAFAAADAWDGHGEPPGWFKNLQTGRYRPGGDPAKEHGPEYVPDVRASV